MSSHEILPVCESITSVCERVIGYEHNDVGNVHVHMILIGCKVSTDTLKNYIKKSGKVPARAGNPFWSFKTADAPVDALPYMSKGVYEPFIVKEFTEQEIADAKAKGYMPERKTGKYQTKLQYIVRETSSEAKKRKNDLIKEMLLELDGHQCINLEYHIDEVIVKVIVKVLNDNNVIFGRYTVRDYYDTICSRKYTGNFIDMIVRFMTPKF